MFQNTLSKMASFCRHFTTTAQQQSRLRNKKTYVIYGPKYRLLAKTKSRMHTGDMNRILPYKFMRLTAKFVNETKLGGSNLLAERMAVHDVAPTRYFCEKKRKYVIKKEMIPEFIIPDLKDFKLKPYVPYNAPEIKQSKFTYKDLFNACYVPRIMKGVESGKIRVEDGKVVYDDDTVLDAEKSEEDKPQ